VSAEIDLSKRSIVLPKVLLQDFAKKNATGTPLDCLRVLLSYLPRECRMQMGKAMAEGVPLNVRFKAHSLRCRRLRAYKPLSEQGLEESEGYIAKEKEEGLEVEPGEWFEEMLT
jgi:hypothetical protein